MGQAFSGPNAFKFFHFTPAATAVLQKDPQLLVALVLVLLGMGALSALAWWIHFVTGRVYRVDK
ncbi:hypothetical protein LOCC1_G008631, partial [Lachnellula occidentalis]